MKKLTSIIMVFMMITCLIACGQNADRKESNTSESLQETIESVASNDTETKDNTSVTDTSKSDGGIDENSYKRSWIEYDTEGEVSAEGYNIYQKGESIEEEETYYEDGVIESYDYYNEVTGETINKSWDVESGELTQEIHGENVVENQIVKQTTYSDGTYVIYEYDNDGNLVGSESYYEDGSLYKSHTWVRDDKGNILEQTIMDHKHKDSIPNYTYESYIKRERDSYGNITSSTQTYLHREKSSMEYEYKTINHTYENEYNDEGFIIKQISYKDGEYDGYTEYTYENIPD